MKIIKNKPLKPLTTFKIGGRAKFFITINKLSALNQAVAWARQKQLKLWVLGGGSNIVVSDAGFNGLVINLRLRGIQLQRRPNNQYWLQIAAGEKWDDVVKFAVKNRLWGIENLSHIPGRAGGAVVQNIGAYGQELSRVLKTVKVFDLQTSDIRIINSRQCRFGYRTSIFNSTAKGRYIILELTMQLLKNGRPDLRYSDLKKHFTQRPNLREIRTAVINIRNRKYPFPTRAKGGSAGSFFKNLYLTKPQYNKLKAGFKKEFTPDDLAKLLDKAKLVNGQQIKVPTAFLIETLGFKGLTNRGAQINPKQPLVILNTGRATANDVMALAEQIIKTAYKRLGVKIELEPELVGFEK